MRLRVPALLLSIAIAPSAIAQQSGVATQTQADDYTRYELLAPGSGRFRILYEVTATTPGATQFFNPIRKGSVASDEHVYDRYSGEPLQFDVVKGDVARAGGVRNADSTSQYIRVHLSRAVPTDGEARVLIDKTYYDPKSYYEENGLLVFSRPLGIKRNVVLLPKSWELIECASPAIVSTDADGRIRISFLNDRDDQLPVKIVARRIP